MLPLFLLSVLLMAVTGFAAWSVHQAKDEAARVVQLGLQRADAVRDLESSIHDLRTHLYAYMRTGQPRHLTAALGLKDKAERYLVRTEKLYLTQNGQPIASGLRRTYTRLDDGLNELSGDASPDAASNLLDGPTADAMIDLARQQHAEQAATVKAAVAEQEEMTRRTTIALTGLGFVGALAGVSLGCLITRRVRNSLMRLEVPVRDAAGQLSQVVGPISVLGSDGSPSLEEQLAEVAQRVGTVVDRLQVSQRDQLRSDQLAAVGQLAAGVAHELRNPLTAMKTIVQTARQGSGELDERDLEVMESEITRLNTSIQSFLDYARPPKLERSRFDLSKVVDSGVQLVSARATQQRVVVRFERPDTPINVDADFDRLRQVVVNLLLNAFDALPEGGDVFLTITVVDERAVLTVADTGTGIDPGMSDRLFEPFTSTKDAGSGLGLSVCRQIIEDHGGKIEARPVNFGAEFAFWVPVAREAHQ